MQRYIIPTALAICSVMLYVLYIDTVYQGIRLQREEKAVILTYLEDAGRAQEKLDKLEAAYQNFPDDADNRLRVFLPETVDPLKFIIDVNAIAKRNGVEVKGPLTTLEPDNTENPLPYKKSKISFITTATYPIFRTFLSDIERSLALRDLSKITFKSEGDNADEGSTKTVTSPEFAVFNYQVEITSYSLH